MIIAEGQFAGRGGHILNGSFQITEEDTGQKLVTSDDFFFDGSPHPGWVFKTGGLPNAEDPTTLQAVAKNKIGDLAPLSEFPHPDISGKQVINIPNGLDAKKFDILFLWCFAVPFLLGVGQINQKNNSFNASL